ncbi:FecR family protein, partial [Lysobacter sp. 2RAB21]
DQETLDAWLDASVAHRVAWLRMEYGWQRIDRLSALRSPRPRDASGTVLRRLRSWPGMAAILAVLVTGLLTLLYTVESTQRYATEVGGHQVVTLSDGSRLELNTATELRVKIGARTREVWLDRGEAYFEIFHDKTRPFAVHAGEQRVVVLGTRFSVHREPDRLRVAVTEGRVRVEAPTPGGQVTAVATRDEVVVAPIDGPPTVVSSSTQVLNALAWRSGRLTFENATLAEAAAEFNRYNRKRLSANGSGTGEIRISGSFDATNPDAFIRLLGRAY